jgi:hypothetical protein
MVRYIKPNAPQKRMIQICIKRGIPMCEKFEYPNGVETSVGYMALTYEKRGNFHYLNGKRVPRNFVIQCGQLKLIGE